MIAPNDASAGREWNPYELATPIVREAAGQPLPTPLARSRPADAMPGRRAYTAAQERDETVLASRSARLRAALIDAVLWCIPLVFVLRAVTQAYRMSALGLHMPLGLFASKMVVALVLWAVLAAWNIAWLVQRGQSVGKRLVGIRIVRPDGSPASAARLLLMRGGAFMVINRLLMGIHPLLATSFALADVLFIFSESRRCLHDRIADTIVINA